MKYELYFLKENSINTPRIHTKTRHLKKTKWN